MTQKFSQWLSTLAVITLMMTLVPLGSAAPAQAWSGTNIRDENVLRTSGVGRSTRDLAGAAQLTDDGAIEGTVIEAAPETASIAELDKGDEAIIPNRQGGNAGPLSNTQVFRVRGGFFKNNQLLGDLPTGGAPEISAAYFQFRDRSSGIWAYVRVSRGADGRWDGQSATNVSRGTGPGQATGYFDDQLTIFCRDSNGNRQAWSNTQGNTGNASAGALVDTPALTASGLNVDTPPGATCNGRTMFSSIMLRTDLTGNEGYGVVGNNSESLSIVIEFVFATPEVSGPVEIWTSVEDDDNYADGWDLSGTTSIGEAPTVETTASARTGTVGTETSIRVAVEDRDMQGNIGVNQSDIRAAIATLIASNGTYVQLIYYDAIDLNYNNSEDSSGQTSQINASDFEQRYHVFDSAAGGYLTSGGSAGQFRFGRPADSGVIRTSLGSLDVDASERQNRTNGVSVTFRFTPNAAAVGTLQVFATGVDRELNSTGFVPIGSFTVGAAR